MTSSGLIAVLAVGVSACGGKSTAQVTTGKAIPRARAALLSRVNPICARDDAAIRDSKTHLANGYSADTLSLIHKEVDDMGAVLFKDKSDAKDARFYTQATSALLHVANAVKAAETPGAGSGVAPTQLLAAKKAAASVGIQCSFGAPGR